MPSNPIVEPVDPSKNGEEEQQIERVDSLFTTQNGPSGTNPGGLARRLFKTNSDEHKKENGRTFWFLSNNEQSPFQSWTVKLTKNSGDVKGGFGIIFCHGNLQGFELMFSVMIRTDGSFQVAKIIKGRYFPFFKTWEYPYHPDRPGVKVIASGYKISNEIKVTYSNEVFRILINGQEVYDFRDSNEPVIEAGIKLNIPAKQGFIVVTTPYESFPNKPVEVLFEEKGP